MKEILLAATLIFIATESQSYELPSEEDVISANPQTLEQFEEVYGFKRFEVPQIINESDPQPEDLEPAWFADRHLSRKY